MSHSEDKSILSNFLGTHPEKMWCRSDVCPYDIILYKKTSPTNTISK